MNDVQLRIGGLDPAARQIGYAAPNGTLHTIHPRAGADMPARRLHEIRAGLIRAIRLNPPQPDLIIMERYSLGVGRMSTMAILGEAGGVMKLALFELDIPFVVIPPSSLKLFATGKGNADKTLMSHSARSLGASPRNDDEADAFHLRRMGRIAHGLEMSLAAYELDAIASCGAVF